MKTPRASRRGRTLRRKKLRGGAISQADMGYHLGSDVLHDFTAGVYEPNMYYHISGGPPITADEPKVVDHFKGKPEIAKRLQVSTVFNVPKNTAVFSSWTAPNLHQVGNDKVGIVYDAGDKITQQLGANNVITFGSVLDPSKKPVQPGDNPIWFDPSVNQITIPLNMFGFDPAKIRSLKIQNFTGNATCAIFDTPTGMFDAIKLSLIHI